MLFFKDKDTGKECLYLIEDGNKQNYECIFSACPKPTCTCMTLDIDLTLDSDGGLYSCNPFKRNSKCH